MKNLSWSIAIIALIISACTSQKQATSYVNDDVYNSTKPQVHQASVQTTTAAPGSQVVTSPDKAKAQPPSATFAEDDNDYSYSSRIKRFSNQDTTKGYFDDAFTGTTDGGGTSVNSPDVNLYFGAGYGDYYGPSFGFGMGWGYPYYGYGYPYYGWGYYPWYDPWYYPYYPYYPYYGYGCCCGYWDYYYPPYYTYESYYGPRNTGSHDGTSSLNARSTTAEAGGQPSARNTEPGSTGIYTRSATEPVAQSGNAGVRSTEPSTRSVQAGSEKYRYARPADPGKTVYTRSAGKEVAMTRTQGAATRQQPTPKYVRPENVTPAQRSGGAQNYTSQAYRQPRSSQEYLAPKTQVQNQERTTGTTRSTRSSGINTRQSTSPGYQNRHSSSPSGSSSKSNYNSSRSGSNSSSPSNNTRTYSAPSRTPSQGSYSAPSGAGKSGGSSAPARSGGSSSPSGGSGGGGHRR